jgi:hypothetical protein
MVRRAAPLLSLLALFTLGCPAHESAGRRGLGDEEGSADDESKDKDKDKDRDRNEGGDDGGGDDNDSTVKVRHKELADAIRENSDGGRGRHDARKLRQALCEGYQDQPKIFYHLVVSAHWHYYWICSDDKPHRVSSKRGKKNLETWLRGFKKQATVQSQDCSSGGRKALTGNHESGIQAVAYCDGRIVLSFPDGGQTQTNFRSQARGDTGGGGDDPGVTPQPPPDDSGTQTAHCPPCPACPSCGNRGRCPDCPVCAACPPPKMCPPPKVCPTCPPPNCQPAAMEAGKKAFRQGVDRACKRICTLIYQKCRSINPNTALCYQLSEYCAGECAK